jgi:hypothetical protein
MSSGPYAHQIGNIRPSHYGLSLSGVLAERKLERMCKSRCSSIATLQILSTVRYNFIQAIHNILSEEAASHPLQGQLFPLQR